MLTHIRPALVLFALFSALTGLAYPLAMTGLAQTLFPHQAHGSLIERDGKLIGSELIGQSFSSPGYFHGRPSATSAPYNAAASSGSNAGPTSKGLIERVQGEAAKRHSEHPDAYVPVDFVTTSGSGLDPHVSPATALFQIPRIAKERGLDPVAIEKLVRDAVQNRWLGVFGEPLVNVLQLNLALDRLARP